MRKIVSGISELYVIVKRQSTAQHWFFADTQPNVESPKEPFFLPTHRQKKLTLDRKFENRIDDIRPIHIQHK